MGLTTAYPRKVFEDGATHPVQFLLENFTDSLVDPIQTWLREFDSSFPEPKDHSFPVPHFNLSVTSINLIT